MPTKEPRTAKELETEISNYLGGLDVIVYDDGMYGWTVAVFAQLGAMPNPQQFVQIVSELRAKYDLKEEPETTEPPTNAETPPEEDGQQASKPDPNGRGSTGGAG